MEIDDFKAEMAALTGQMGAVTVLLATIAASLPPAAAVALTTTLGIVKLRMKEEVFPAKDDGTEGPEFLAAWQTLETVERALSHTDRAAANTNSTTAVHA